MMASDEDITIARCRRDGHAYVLIDGVRVRVELDADGDLQIIDGTGRFSSECWDDQCACGGDLRKAVAQVLDALGPPHRMDVPDGPVCRCGQPSTHQSGWCGACDVTAPR